ncbi:protoporphyrinogen oxidase [Chlamydia sp. 17-3921]|uniref:protoporphyrinogen oxidase n=1 Tax=Chlamydia sp. 17-3921 TaxID=2675798 RepID=UPI001918B5F1|nr:protoporphyrinogen oxidase [Chlamydia sp. 17-3921]
MNKVIIIGSGISGLASAWWLHKKFPNAQLIILDKATSPGGLLFTIQKQGFSFDLGPKGFLTQGEGEFTLKLIKELGLNDALIFNNKAAKKRYIHYKGKTRKISFLSLIQEGLLTSLIKDLFAPCYPHDSSIEAFFERHSTRNLTKYILNPVVTAIRAGRSSNLSTYMAFPSLAKREAETGSLLRSYLKELFSCQKRTKKEHTLATLQPSLKVLIDTLKAKIPAEWKFSSPVIKIISSSENVQIMTPSETLSADLAIYTGPLNLLSSLTNISNLKILEERTLSWHFSSTALGWHSSKFSLPKGYGMLFAEEPPLLGIVWNSQIFPQQALGKTSLSLLLEGFWHEAEAYACSIAAISKYLGISQKPDAFSLFSPRDGVPQHSVGFLEARQRILPSLPKTLKFVGQNIAGPGLNRCIASAYNTIATL